MIPSLTHRLSSRRFCLLAMTTLIWMIVIFLFSAQNGEDSLEMSATQVDFFRETIAAGNPPEQVSGTDAQVTDLQLTLLYRKAAHMTEFGILAVLCLLTLFSVWGREGWCYLAAFGTASFYAATDEAHQIFVAGRTGRVTDWVIDSGGALLFLGAAWALMRLREKKNKE